jgi:hypothetical protein
MAAPIESGNTFYSDIAKAKLKKLVDGAARAARDTATLSVIANRSFYYQGWSRSRESGRVDDVDVLLIASPISSRFTSAPGSA